ncbi:BA75_01356T0 [Komagataella pastoris]|uniref:Glutamate--cysteine ligase n=1 Tax=Komagataella pastoris TaxID=4922 RepID=A0A1B2J978_PICPA|nr:BA75_01356T0 [Komagataella pastoris]
MGLLSLGTPYSWFESRSYCDHVKKNALEQLYHCFEAAKNRSDDKYFWGDEVEYMVVHMDAKARKAQLSIDEDHVFSELDDEKICDERDVSYHPEYGRFMIEATPYRPYDGDSLSHYLYVQENMDTRRQLAQKYLKDPDAVLISLTTFPRMGTDDFTFPAAIAGGPSAKSLFVPEEITNRHVRFPTLTANIRRRRGCKVAINIPLYKDKYTRKDDELDPTIPFNRSKFPYSDAEAGQGAALPGHIYMDAMGFGMGSSCLQITMQAQDLKTARYLYDSLMNIAPLALSASASAPIFRGFLADQDVRWNVISGAVDDRTPYERGVDPLPGHGARGNIKEGKPVIRIPKSRYDSVDQYLSDPAESFNEDSYNDLDSPINEEAYKTLLSYGFDSTLARHFAHLFIRDPIVIFNERVHQDNTKENDHFENIQSTNWQTLRFKPPTQFATPDQKDQPGWRVELRPMEISITSFENAAYSVFFTLLSKAILLFRPNFYLPVSLIEENMVTAHRVDSIIKEKFHFRVNTKSVKGDAKVKELTIKEVFHGSSDFEGLISLVNRAIDSQSKSWAKEFSLPQEFDHALGKLKVYIKFIGLRTSGEIPSTARFIRDFVTKHPEYKQDSVVSDSVSYDLLDKLVKLTKYEKDTVAEFFGPELTQDLEAFQFI